MGCALLQSLKRFNKTDIFIKCVSGFSLNNMSGDFLLSLHSVKNHGVCGKGGAGPYPQGRQCVVPVDARSAERTHRDSAFFLEADGWKMEFRVSRRQMWLKDCICSPHYFCDCWHDLPACVPLIEKYTLLTLAALYYRSKYISEVVNDLPSKRPAVD